VVWFYQLELWKGLNMKNSYNGYWFTCETTYRHEANNVINPRKWILLLESKANNKVHTIGLNNQMTLGEVTELAYIEKNQKTKNIFLKS
jgi:hypothetical protein